MIKTSAIILVYHDEKYLKDCVASLRESAKLAKVNLQIIIVVNDINLKKNNFLFPKNCTLIFNKQNLGFGKSINLAVEKARGDWLLIVNVDTITNRNTFEKLFFYANEKDIGIIAPKIVNPDGSLQFSMLDKPTIWNIFKEQSYLYKFTPSIFRSSQSNKSLYNFTHQVNYVSGVYLLIRKLAFNKINGFDENFFIYFEDFDLCENIRNLGYKIKFIHDVKITHFKHQSFGGIKDSNIFIESYIKYMTKWRNKYYAKIALLLVILGSLFRLSYWLLKSISRKNLTQENLQKIGYYQSIIKKLLSIVYKGVKNMSHIYFL